MIISIDVEKVFDKIQSTLTITNLGNQDQKHPDSDKRFYTNLTANILNVRIFKVFCLRSRIR